MQEKTQAVVLHTTKYGEGGLIVDVFSEQRGAMSFAVRKPRGRHSTLHTVLLSPLSLLQLDYDYRDNRRLQQIDDMQLLEPYNSMPYHPVKQTIALFLSEFLYYTLRNEQHNPSLFLYIATALRWLDAAQSGMANYPATFLIRLTRFLGIMPDSDEACRMLTPQERTLVPLIMRMDFHNMHLFRFTREQRAHLMRVLNDYYRAHVPGFPQLRSMDILREVLS